MKKLLIALTLVMGVSAHAAEEQEAVGTVSKTESSFHLVTFKCAPDHANGPETTPQSPPLDVDDPGTPGCNQWEINVIADGDLASGQKEWELPLLDINYGIGDNLQLKYEIPYISQQNANGSQAAVGEAKAGVKYQFYQNEETDEALAFYPQLSIVSPDPSSMQKEIASAGKIVTLPLLYSRKIGETAMGEINLTANVGLNLSSKADTTNYVSAAVGLGVPVHPKFSLMGEISTEQGLGKLDEESRQQLLKVNLGFVGTVSKNILFFASAGHSLSTSDESPHAYVLSGLRLLSSNN